MEQEKKLQRTHRLCPCSPMDLEGIQSWLEDMAAQGWLLEQDSIFLGIWSFEKAHPQSVRYRLEIMRPSFWGDSDAPEAEAEEIARAMGWEYICRYRNFYIYRSTDPTAPPLHTDPALQSLSVRKLRRSQMGDLILGLFYLIMIFCFRRSSFGYLYLDAAIIGPAYAISMLLFLLALAAKPILNICYLQRAIHRLRCGQGLDRKLPWKPAAPLWVAWRLIPVVIIIVICISLLGRLSAATSRSPLEDYDESAPLVTIEDLYPEAAVTSRMDMGDYNTFLQWQNPLSENTEWCEAGSIQLPEGSFHFILRVQIYETAGLFLAKGVFRDQYTEDASRYGSKRFEAMEVPENSLEDALLYSSYGIRHILLRQGNTVIHATVSITHGEEDRWIEWFRATESLLLTA